MFAARYFTLRYWAARFWPKVGSEPTDVEICDEPDFACVLPSEPTLSLAFARDPQLACEVPGEPTLALRC